MGPFYSPQGKVNIQIIPQIRLNSQEQNLLATQYFFTVFNKSDSIAFSFGWKHNFGLFELLFTGAMQAYHCVLRTTLNNTGTQVQHLYTVITHLKSFAEDGAGCFNACHLFMCQYFCGFTFFCVNNFMVSVFSVIIFLWFHIFLCQ